jgi:2-polyprenyl-6-methoxyphenol hydroxylase-like FAD-dependent oxidoreductase
VHINTAGSRALHSCLPPKLFEAFLATCGQPTTGIGLVTHRSRELVWFASEDTDGERDPVDSYKSVSRISLRQVLLAGLADVSHFNKTFPGYDTDGNEAVTVAFADGSTAAGDVLGGADGGNSVVRRQDLPHAERIDTGVVGIHWQGLADRRDPRPPPRHVWLAAPR